MLASTVGRCVSAASSVAATSVASCGVTMKSIRQIHSSVMVPSLSIPSSPIIMVPSMASGYNNITNIKPTIVGSNRGMMGLLRDGGALVFCQPKQTLSIRKLTSTTKSSTSTPSSSLSSLSSANTNGSGMRRTQQLPCVGGSVSSLSLMHYKLLSTSSLLSSSLITPANASTIATRSFSTQSTTNSDDSGTSMVRDGVSDGTHNNSLSIWRLRQIIARQFVRVSEWILRSDGTPSAPRGFGHFQHDADKDSKNVNQPPGSSSEETKEPKQEPSSSPSSSSSSSSSGRTHTNAKHSSGQVKSSGRGPVGGGSGPTNEYLAGLLFVGVLGLFLFYSTSSNGAAGTSEITWQQFKSRYLETGQVDHLTVIRSSGENNWPTIMVALRAANADARAPGDTSSRDSFATSVSSNKDGRYQYHFKMGSVATFERMLDQAQRDLDIDPRDYVPVHYSTEGVNTQKMFDTALNIASVGIMAALCWSFLKGSGGAGKIGGRNIFSIGKSGAQKLNPGELTNVKFADVAGLDEAKVEIMEFVKFLKNPEQFKKLGAKLPKGALLVGPPGTGKTLLAKATAGEASVPFFSISGSDFIEMFVGVGPSRVRDLFAQARQSSPCIIFIDEIDAVGRARGSGKFGGNDERENTLNQLLVEMDGFQTQEGIVVLAGTNRVDILDKALLRPGRFDRTITIDKPDIRGRVAIFEVHLKKLTLDRPIKELAQKLAALTPGFAGADIQNICNEAAILAARADKKAVELIDFEKATERVIGGLEKKHSVLTKHEKELVAYHESGHAVAGWFLEHADPLLKVTIVPRGSGALGFAQYLPKELNLYQQDQLSDMMCMTLAGRAAEQVFFGKISTGAGDDLNKVTKLAYAQVSKYGMSSKLGNVAWPQSEESFQKPFSEVTAQLIDQEVQEIVRNAYDRAIRLLTEKKDFVQRLAVKLLDVETVNHDQLVECLGQRPFKSDAYLQFLHHSKEEATATTAEKKPSPPTPSEAEPTPAVA